MGEKPFLRGAFNGEGKKGKFEMGGKPHFMKGKAFWGEVSFY